MFIDPIIFVSTSSFQLLGSLYAAALLITISGVNSFISLFTNFHLKKDDNKSSLFLAEYFDNDEFISCGVLTKYGKSISIKRGENDYIIKYTEGLVKYNYHSQEFIKDKLSFHWKIKECPASTKY